MDGGLRSPLPGTQTSKKSPYTRRILPPFLIPRSPFRCDDLLDYLSKNSSTSRIDVETACECLGCVDPRTARKHARNIGEAIKSATAAVALAAEGVTTETRSQDFPPEANGFTLLTLLLDSLTNALTRLHGTKATAVTAGECVIFFWPRSCPRSMSHVSEKSDGADTS